MLICHVRQAAGRCETGRTGNRRSRTNTVEHAIVAPSVIVVAAIVAPLRMTNPSPIHSVRNQSAQDSLCVEHAPHIRRRPRRFASIESRGLHTSGTFVTVAPERSRR